KHPTSLLVRFLGLHSLSMYGNEFTFVVMKNVFPLSRISDKYDVKGSWVGRHATRKAPGKRATCKYCNEYFVEGSASKCSEVIGPHEAVVTLKDNDMVNKIRLQPEAAYALIDILHADADALCSMGMMDYSLLVGVQMQQFELGLG
ncbi:phosphatidylinositol-4-phosphate 5-kinase, partial [Ochromonadaceae sp. CCMP2298]